jgi:acyl-CoA synthetase (AMP-forming)/AMP-acid ligase II
MTDSLSLLASLAEHGRTTPDSAALVTGGERVTYAQLWAMAHAALAQLNALDLPPAAPVAVYAAKSPRTIALIIACMLARRPFLLPSAELGASSYCALLERAGCATILTAEPAHIQPDSGAAPQVYHIQCAPGGGHAEHGAAAASRPASGPDTAPECAGDISFMLTTSGSTGLPKIVPLSFGAVDRFTGWAAAQFGLGPATIALNYAPLNFDLCLLDIWAVLKAGGTAVLVAAGRATDGVHLADLVRAERIDFVQAVPMCFRLLADASGAAPFAGVRHVLVTGDKVSARLLGTLWELFPSARLYNVYGCTETNDSFLHEIAGNGAGSHGTGGQRGGAGGTEVPGSGGVAVPIGRPLPGVDAVIADEDGLILHGQASGELLVHTPFQTAGYLDPPGTAHRTGKFVRLGGGDRPYFRTGDLVHRDEAGIYTLLGRNDFQVKVRGTRVNLEEIERIFLDHAKVLEAAVIGVPDDLAGTRIHAFIRGAAPGSPNSMALRDHCRLRLPRAAIPSTIKLIDYPLPKTPTGKVDRQTIKRTLLNRS